MAMALGGFFQSTLPVNVTLAQQIAPVSAATVVTDDGLLSTGGLSVRLASADRFGIESTLMAMAFVPLLGVVCALALPRDHQRQQIAVAETARYIGT